VTSGGRKKGPRFGILGDLEVTVDRRRLALRGPKQRGLLAMLVIR
jgi:DNA-binding SARP family transcriptional activator